MKRILAPALTLFCATSFAATLNPIQLLNPAGSSSGQAIISTGASTAPAWMTITPAAIGGLQASNNLSDVASATAALTNLGGLSTTAAASTYLTQANAASTYLTQANAASTYLTQANATSTYATISNLALKAPIASPTFTGTVTIPAGASISGFAPLASPTFTGSPVVPGYLTTATASSTYAPLASPSLTGTPVAPTAANATSTTQIATTAFVQTQSINTGTMTSVGGARAIGTTYTNSGARPRFVYATINPGSATTVTITINGVAITGPGSTAAGISLFTAFIVPPGGTYAVTVSGTGNALYSWVELQ